MRYVRFLAMLLATCGAACAATDKPVSPQGGTAAAYAGWYMEHAGQGRFQPCGEEQPLAIPVAADLPAKAREFGLAEDTPVYVRVTGERTGKELRVISVQQFGSRVPVRDCGMNGVVIPSPGSERP